MTEDKKSVDVGPIWNNDHANEVAADWIGKNPGWEFRGEWRTTQPVDKCLSVFIHRVRIDLAP